MTKASVPADDPPTKLTPGRPGSADDDLVEGGAAWEPDRRASGQHLDARRENGGSLAELLDCRRFEAAGDGDVDERPEEDEHGQRRATAPGEESPADAADERGIGNGPSAHDSTIR